MFFCNTKKKLDNRYIYDTYSHDIGEYTTGSTSVRKTSTSGATTLFDSTFYVLSSARNVYKCLDNNGGATSTDEPTGVSTSVITTTDSYKWKFMYTLSAAQQANFLSTDFMAVSPNSIKFRSIKCYSLLLMVQ